MSTRRLLQQNNNSRSGVPYQLATPGNTAPLGAATFTRADPTTCATQITTAGVLQLLAANVLRDAHYVRGQRTILLEESRINVAKFSDAFNNAFYGGARLTVSPDAAISPDGTQNADKFVEDNTAGSTHYRSNASSFVVTANQNHALSLFLKADTRTRMRLSLEIGADTVYNNVNMGAGTAASGAVGAGVVAASEILPLGLSWYRAWIAGKPAGAGTSLQTLAYLADAAGSISYSGDNVSGDFNFGIQLETNVSFATSYIPTGAAAVTRAVDALSLAGVNLVGTLFYHYYDLATSAWADAVAAYAGNVAIVPPVNRAYSHIAVIQGTQSAAQCKAILGGTFP